MTDQQDVVLAQILEVLPRSASVMCRLPVPRQKQRIKHMAASYPLGFCATNEFYPARRLHYSMGVVKGDDVMTWDSAAMEAAR